MCGIAGWLGRAEEGDLWAKSLAGALRHRGPDAHAAKIWPGAGLVHTRLSIIDLSPAGAQPMANEDGTVWIVFNGEIYNHHELRRKLEDKGHRFRGRADSEVLPHLYEEYGPAFLERLNGMFAFAVYDSRSQKMLLARDRFGIKPLFYSQQPGRLLFASEINAFRHIPGVDFSPDPQAVADFSALCFIPAPGTFFKGIRNLEPGQFLEVSLLNGEVSVRTGCFHRWVLAPDAALRPEEAAERADQLIRAAVKNQLESDVSLGSLLSGGIDSSLVSTAAQDSTRHLKTFNVRFPDKDYDETWAAEAVARHIGSEHTILDMPSGAGTWENVTALLRHAGQPFADTSLFAVNAVCHLMRQHITVALSGDGGDEAFGGYHLYWQIARIARLRMFPPWLWRAAGLGLEPLAAMRLIPSHLPQRVRSLAGADDVAIVQSMFCWVREAEQGQLCQDHGAAPLRRLFEPRWTHHLPKNASPLEKLSALTTEANIRVVLPNDYLFKVDCASMRESLEVRVPMLDEDLVAFGLTLPHRLKVRRRQTKVVLRKVAERRLPRGVARKRKMGFAIPVDVWADPDFKAVLRDKLLARGSPLAGFFHEQTYRPWIEAFAANQPCAGVSRPGLYQRVIMLLAVYLAVESGS